MDVVVACREARLRSLFREFDKDGSGLIDRSELDKVFEELGKDFTDDELQRMIGLADQDESGTLNYEEFISYVFGWGDHRPRRSIVADAGSSILYSQYTVPVQTYDTLQARSTVVAIFFRAETIETMKTMWKQNNENKFEQ